MSQAMTAPTGAGSGNPALSESFFETHLTSAETGTRTMSVAGISVKTLALLAFVVAGGSWGWASATSDVPVELGSGYADTTVTIPGGFWLASLGAFFIGIMITVAPRRAAVLGVLYALAEGFVLGAISAAFDAQTEGIVGAAVLSTLCVFVVALLLYVTRIVKPTRKLAFAVIAGMGGLMLLYFVVFVMSIFDWGWLYSESFRTVGLVITLISVALAALSLVLDFGSIETGVEAGAPQELEWYMAFSLMVTLIWLYMTLLKLIAMLTRNR
jgi:uncharacterized YccA/Bax inhibitor family protein